MLRTCLHTGRLQTKDRLVCANTRQERVSAETLPVSTSLCNTAHVHHRAQCDVNALAAVFFSHRNTTGTDQRTFPSVFIQTSFGGSQNIDNIKTYVAAALIPAGKPVTKSAARTPSGESSRHRPGKSSTGGVFPTQRPPAKPTPVVILTFCSRVKEVILKPKKSCVIVRFR